MKLSDELVFVLIDSFDLTLKLLITQNHFNCGVSSLDYNQFDFWQHNQSKFLHSVNRHTICISYLLCFSNPGVLVVIDYLSLFLSSFLNPQIPWVLWHPQHPAIYNNLQLRSLTLFFRIFYRNNIMTFLPI